MGVAQLVRVVVCGTIGRGFEPHHPPLVSDVSSDASLLFLLKLSNAQPIITTKVNMAIIHVESSLMSETICEVLYSNRIYE